MTSIPLKSEYNGFTLMVERRGTKGAWSAKCRRTLGPAGDYQYAPVFNGAGAKRKAFDAIKAIADGRVAA